MIHIEEYFCLDCEGVFTEPKQITELHGERWDACPFCGGSFVKAILCDCCKEYVTSDYIKTEDEQIFCDNCFLKYSIYDAKQEDII